MCDYFIWKKMIKVLYDYQAFTIQYFGGVSKCFCELISNFPNDVTYEIGIRQSNNVHLRQSGLVNCIRPIIDRQSFLQKFNFKGAWKIYSLLSTYYNTAESVNRDLSIKLLKEGNYDIFHPTFFDTYFLKYVYTKPFVVTVHDMIPELFPQFFGKNNPESARKKLMCEKAAAIVAVSQHTKDDLVRIFKIPAEKITVIHHGAYFQKRDTSVRIISNPYFLYVGLRWGYKNFIQTLNDFSIFSRKHNEVKLVCTGPSFTKQELSEMRRLNISDKLIHIQATDSQLLNLYSHAIAFIYPSLYEGFGMPILEAMSQECICLLNRKSCFPEIGGDAALYFNSNIGDSDLPVLLEKVYTMSPKEKNEVTYKGLHRLEDFSWKDASQKLSHLYKSLI